MEVDYGYILATKIIRLDRENPGDFGAEMVIDAMTWAELVQLAKKVKERKNTYGTS